MGVSVVRDCSGHRLGGDGPSSEGRRSQLCEHALRVRPLSAAPRTRRQEPRSRAIGAIRPAPGSWLHG